jgi:hypothetical protein
MHKKPTLAQKLILSGAIPAAIVSTVAKKKLLTALFAYRQPFIFPPYKTGSLPYACRYFIFSLFLSRFQDSV